MRWSPFLPAFSGVMPSPHFCHASIDLQMWMPRSLTMLVFTTLLPQALRISASENPSRLLRTCPRCRGLLVLGDEYSTITSGEFSSACFMPKSGVSMMCSSTEFQNVGSITRLRNPFITLKRSTAGSFSTSQLPISVPTASGLFRAAFTHGNTTTVRLPSNSFLVVCGTIEAGSTAMP